MSEADRWRTVSAVLAGICVILTLQLWMFGTRLQAASFHDRGSLQSCPLSLEDLEHS